MFVVKPAKKKPGAIPEKEKAVICGCMSTRHKFLGSCMSCGRIKCSMEVGFTGVCPFCGAQVVGPMSADEVAANGFDEATVASYRHKDKLLQFDRENAKRTHVHDAQGDYYESATWLSDTERAKIDKKEEERKKKLTTRQTSFTLDLITRKLTATAVADAPETSEEEAAQEAEAARIDEYSRREGPAVHPTTSCGLDPEADVEDVYESRGTNITFKKTVVRDEGVGDEPCAPLGVQSRMVAVKHASAMENDILSGQKSKAGDIYRLMKINSALAPSAPTESTVVDMVSVRVQHGSSDV